jgi:hypothetical protein
MVGQGLVVATSSEKALHQEWDLVQGLRPMIWTGKNLVSARLRSDLGGAKIYTTFLYHFLRKVGKNGQNWENQFCTKALIMKLDSISGRVGET